MSMQKITPHLWFDKEAKEAAAFYVSTFADAKIKNSVVLHDTPSGSVDMLTIELMGYEFALISAGPLFKFNPSISFLVACKTPEEVELLWDKLSPGSKVLMELGKYPFSEKYGWIQDRYGVSWQIMYMAKQEIEQRIIPMLLFVGEQCGRAEEAINLYTSVFHDSKVGQIMRYNPGEAPDKEGTVRHAAFTLEGQAFAAMDSAHKHEFAFNEAVSLIVHCETQAEIDYYWEKLSADPSAEQCGWIKDKFGLSWQITPTSMDKIFSEEKDQNKLDRVTQAFLKMKKFDIAKLEEAYNAE